jgi:restriction system protein
MNLFRGWIGEKKTAFFLWASLNRKTYHIFHNIILLSKNGTTQIDHLIVSIYGLFIVETKNKKGWIFGSAEQKNWTQSIYGDKYSFQNPLKQTYRQKIILGEFLHIDNRCIFPVIHFTGDCTFKTELPDNVRTHGVGRYIKTFRDEIFSNEDVDEAVNTIKSFLSESTFTNCGHIKSLEERHSSNTICPSCGSKLVERTAKQGKYKGKTFLGCSNYPKCRFVKR